MRIRTRAPELTAQITADFKKGMREHFAFEKGIDETLTALTTLKAAVKDYRLDSQRQIPELFEAFLSKVSALKIQREKQKESEK